MADRMRNYAEDVDSPLSSPTHDRPLLPPLQRTQTRSPRFIIAIVFAIVFILNFGAFLTQVPSIRLYEDIICHHYYKDVGMLGNIEEGECKGADVQEELNVVMAGLLFLGAVPSLVTTIPYGLVADRMGRKPVFALSIVGIILAQCWNLMVVRFWRYMPLRLVWISPIFTLIGGGEAVANMVFFAMGSDITTDEQRANLFLAGQCVSLASELIAPSIASGLMIISPWIPIILGLCMMVFAISLSALFPETLNMRRGKIALPTSPTTPRPLSPKTPSIYSAVKHQFKTSLHGVRESTSILNSFPVLLLLFGFIVQPFSRQSIDLSIRYISNRFSWPLRRAGFLLSLRAAINIILLLIILPALSHFLISKRSFSTKRKDLLLARISVLILVLGALLIAASPTSALTIFGLAIWTLGTGYVPLTRSLITTLVDSHHVGRLYAAIAVVETVGALAAGPSLAALYTLGLRMKGPWVGLPFFCLAVITAIAGVGVWVFGRTMGEMWKGRDLSGEEGGQEEGQAMLLEDEDEEEA